MQRLLHTYRDELKGLAILWIVFFHAELGLSGPVRVIQQIGYGGVDIFFLLSGVGLFYSLERSSDIRKYAGRRMQRILPAYLPFCILWLCLILPHLRLRPVAALRTVLGNLLMVGYWANVPQMLSWYLSGLLTVIVLAPFFHACLCRKENRLRNAVLLLTASVLAGCCFAYDDRIIIMSRLPIFVIGMLLAIPGEKKSAPAVEGIALTLSFAVGAALLYLCWTRLFDTLQGYGMYWYPFTLMTVPICGALGWVLSKLEKGRKWFAPLRYLGKASFEIFLFNCGMEIYYKRGLDVEAGPLLWMLGSLGCLAAGCLYHWLVEKATKWVKDKAIASRA